MGADLVGYMVMGPVDILQENIDQALERLEALKTKATETLKALEKTGELDPEPQPWAAELYGIKIGEYFFDDWLEFLEDAADLNPEVLLNNIIDFWNSGSRDAVSRIIEDKNGKDVRILFAGDMSWGDEPGGWGYECLRDVHKYGIESLLGLY